MSLIDSIDLSIKPYSPGQLYLPLYLGGPLLKGQQDQNALVNKLMAKSGGMLGHGENGPISEAVSGGVLRLNKLAAAYNNNLNPKRQKEINSYNALVTDGMRQDSTVLASWLKGFGSSPDDIAPNLNKEFQYNTARWMASELATKARLQNPDIEVKKWMEDLKINFDNLEKALVNPFQIDEDMYIQPELYKRLVDLGLNRLKIPKQFGGMGFNQREYDAILRTLIHTYSGTIAGTVSAHSTLGSKPFEYYGDFDQKRYYLPKIAKGEGLVSFALTERGSGTDAINNSAVIAKKVGNKFVLNSPTSSNSKVFITNTHKSSVMLIFAKVDDGGQELKPTVFIKELPFRLTDTKEDINRKRKELEKEGLYISKPLELSGIRGSNQAYIEFHNLEISERNDHGVKNILGDVGEGTKVIFNSLNTGRAGFGAFCAESAKVAFNMAVLEAIQRQRFDEHGGRLADLPQVKEYISEMAVRTEALDAAVELTSKLIDTYPHMNIIAECAAIKALATEEAGDITKIAVRMFGGQSLMKGFPAELMMRDMWVPIIVEGVNEALKQHLVGVGVKPLLKASLDPRTHIKREVKMLKYESGGLSYPSMIWLENKTKLLSARVKTMGVVDKLTGKKTMLKQKELIAFADEVIDLYQTAAVMLKLKDLRQKAEKLKPEDKNPYEHKILALQQFVNNMIYNKKPMFIKGILPAKDLYPDNIANAYIKVAEDELKEQRQKEKPMFKNENGPSDLYRSLVRAVDEELKAGLVA